MWCKTTDGSLVNLSKAVSIYIYFDEKNPSIRASFEVLDGEVPLWYIIYVGENMRDCAEILDSIAERLGYLDLSGV